ncbi:glycoside hydrolase family protein [Vibrio penaeicida]|uniref:glycoside hydrolase family protein n=1 Tax=Vibrio penaeicida TaxID=104609 RepID=UPI001CC6D9BB|nr:hypothetical protein [Vibrio penaeicida]
MRAGPQLNQLTKPLLIAVIALTGGFEGYRLIAYQDSGGVWTACYGETLGIQPDARFSPEECDAMFGASLSRHNTPLSRSLMNYLLMSTWRHWIWRTTLELMRSSVLRCISYWSSKTTRELVLSRCVGGS